MKITKKQLNNCCVAVIESNETVIGNTQDVLDLLATVSYDTGCDRIILPKSAVVEEFFDLSTRIAGDVLQKFVNYHAKLAIVGDHSNYSSKSLKDFIYESNKGNNVCFAATQEEAEAWMDRASNH